MEEYIIFSKRLKEAMLKRNRMKQSELSEKTGITVATLSRYINGKRVPKATEIAKIADALDVSCNYLMGTDDDMNGEKVGTINVAKALEYCEKAADTCNELCDKALKNIGHGDSHVSAYGALAYFSQKEEMYRYEIPNIIKTLSKLE